MMRVARHNNAMTSRTSARYLRRSRIRLRAGGIRPAADGLEADAEYGRTAGVELNWVAAPPDIQGRATLAVPSRCSWARTWLAYADVPVSAAHEAATAATSAVTHSGNR